MPHVAPMEPFLVHVCVTCASRHALRVLAVEWAPVRGGRARALANVNE